MPRARPKHIHVAERVGEASNPGPPGEEGTTSQEEQPLPSRPPRKLAIIRASPACKGDPQPRPSFPGFLFSWINFRPKLSWLNFFFSWIKKFYLDKIFLVKWLV